MELSVIVITRNEEAAIGSCLESVLKQTEGLEREVILVDSASTDRTVEIARRYPITIIRIDACSGYSPAAGRYVGTKRATGKYVLFLDGDNILIEGWLQTALTHFQDETVAAIAGRIFVVLPGEELSFKHPPRYIPGKAKYLPTAGMYRRSVIQKVGTFNPFVRGEEERELAFRITEGGFSILRLDTPMVYHVMKPRTKSEQDEKAGYFTGLGQIFRRYGFRSISWDLIVAQRKTFAVNGMVAVVACLLIAFLALKLIGLFLVLLSVAALAIVLPAIRKGWMRAFLFFRGEFLRARNIILGFRRGIPKAEDFWATTADVAGAGVIPESPPASRQGALRTTRLQP